jgi:hypothetical protein
MVADSTKAALLTATDGGRCENTVTYGWWMVVNDKHYSFGG